MATESLRELARRTYPWMPEALVDVWADAYVEFGNNTALALQEVRNGEGREVYDQTFPGIRRDDGTLRMRENEYLSTLQSYRNSLRLRGLNPDVFESRLPELISGEVSPDEFESRISAVNEQIVGRGEEFRRAFAQAAGVDDFSEEGVLATVLDPEGVGRELLERRLSVAQVRGSALQQGIDRDLERARFLVQQGVDAQQVQQFDRTAQDRLRRLRTIEQATRGRRSLSIGEVEDAVLLQEQQQVDNLTRLFGRERALFTTQRGLVRRDRAGRVTGLSAP